MKKLISALLVLVMVFAIAGCGTPDEIVKEKKLRKSNFDTYLQIEVVFDSVSTNYSAYDGNDPKYEGGRWKWGTGNATVKVSPKTTNEAEFTNCEVSAQINFGFFGSKDVSLKLDEKGCASQTFALETSKAGIPKEGFTSTDYATPVAAYSVLDASGDMKIHIKLDENGSVITETEE